MVSPQHELPHARVDACPHYPFLKFSLRHPKVRFQQRTGQSSRILDPLRAILSCPWSGGAGRGDEIRLGEGGRHELPGKERELHYGSNRRELSEMVPQ
jgi:hypothetical protein